MSRRKMSLDLDNTKFISSGRRISLDQNMLSNRLPTSMAQFTIDDNITPESVPESKQTIEEGSFSNLKYSPKRKLTLSLETGEPRTFERRKSLQLSKTINQNTTLGFDVKMSIPEELEASLEDLFFPNEINDSGRRHTISLLEEASASGWLSNIRQGLGKKFEQEKDEKEESSDEEVEPISTEPVENEIQGEFALDMFIDPLNPVHKEVHTTLKSMKQKQEQEKEELIKIRAKQREERIIQLQLEKEKQRKDKQLERMHRKLEAIKFQREQAEEKNEKIVEQLSLIYERRRKYYDRLAEWLEKMENLYQAEMQITVPLEETCKSHRAELVRLQKERMDNFKDKIDPIIIRDGPSSKTNYKIQIKYTSELGKV